MDLGGAGWGIITIVGPLLLAAVLLWALLRNRKSPPEEIDRTEQATRDLYRAEDEAHRGEDDKVP
ncbi:MAG TPA: hypothetical protein VGW34_16030 [Allosphingosinicella sp.]|nr:hypothetical protein [Allosphingosinicella sp.]